MEGNFVCRLDGFSVIAMIVFAHLLVCIDGFLLLCAFSLYAFSASSSSSLSSSSPSSLSPIEAVFQKHVRRSLLLYEDYYKVTELSHHTSFSFLFLHSTSHFISQLCDAG